MKPQAASAERNIAAKATVIRIIATPERIISTRGVNTASARSTKKVIAIVASETEVRLNIFFNFFLLSGVLL